MTPFRIVCVTCSAGLSVRNEALLGQIVACPKCNSMVLVERPSGSTPMAPTETQTASPAVAADAPTAPASGEFDELANVLPPHTDSETTHVAANTDQAAEPPSATAPTGSGGSSQTMLWIGGGAVLGALVVGAAMAWFSGGSDQPLAANETPSPTAGADEQELGAPIDGSGAPPTNEPPSPDAAELLQAPNDNVVAETEPGPSAALDDVPADVPAEDAAPALPADPFAADEPLESPRVAEPPAADVADGGPPPPADEPQPRLVIDSPPAPPARPVIDPLDVDPEGLNLASLLAGPPPPTPAETPLSDESEVAATLPQEVAPPEPQPVDANLARRPVRRDPDGSPLGAPPDVASALAVRLPAVQVKQMPLCRFVDFVTQLTGTSVSVSPQQLQLAAATAGRSVSVDVQDATLQQVLTAALEPLRLAPAATDSHVVLVRANLPARRTIEYPVSDLTDSDVTAETIAQWIRRFVAPDSWASAGGDGRIAVVAGALSIDAPEPVQYETLLLLEGIRKARGLTPKSRYPAKLIRDRSPYFALHERLSGPATFNFTAYTPLRAIFRHWQEETATAMLVDWPALAEARLWPPTRIACSQHDVPWSEALDAVLQPLGLGWRAVDERTIQITNGAVLATQFETHIYRTSDHVPVEHSQTVGDGVALLRAPVSVHREIAAGQ